MPKPYTAVRAHQDRTLTIEAYVPNRDRNGALVHNHEHWVKLIEASLSELSGGGVTTYEARGYWRGGYEHTSIVRASVHVTAYTHEAAVAIAHVAQTLGAFGVETGQELAGFTVDGAWFWAVLADGSKS